MTPTTPPTPIDFAAIRSRCPRAFEKLRKWLINTPTPRDWDMRDGQLRHAESRQRDLFDFFDQQGIIVTVYYEMLAFHVSIHIGQDTIWLRNATRATRAAAETAAFTAGFEKLEEMLNQKEG